MSPRPPDVPASPTSATARRTPGAGTVRTALLLDVVAVVAFAAAGRQSHAGSVDVTGTAGTAWPYLVALLLGWGLARAWRRPAWLRTALTIWPVTVVVGTGLRAATGSGTALPFVLVATAVLGAALLGWRGAALLTRRGAGPQVGAGAR